MSDPFSREERIRVLEKGLAVRRQYLAELAEQEQFRSASHTESDDKSSDSFKLGVSGDQGLNAGDGFGSKVAKVCRATLAKFKHKQ